MTWRGIITKILCTPYARDPFELGVTRYNDTIYIEEHETEFKRAQNQNQDARGRLMGFWGYRFESLSTVSSFPSKTDPVDKEELESRKSSVVNTNEQYCTVVKTRLGNTSIVMGAEVDCTSGKPNAMLSNSPICLLSAHVPTSTKKSKHQPFTELYRTEDFKINTF